MCYLFLDSSFLKVPPSYVNKILLMGFLCWEDSTSDVSILSALKAIFWLNCSVHTSIYRSTESWYGCISTPNWFEGCINREVSSLIHLMFMIHASKILLLNIMLPRDQGYLKIVVLLVPYYGFGSSFLLIAWWTIAVWYMSSAKSVPSVLFALFFNNTWLIVI